MIEFLDPNWLDVLIGAIALIIGTALSVYFFRKEHRSKKLSYEIVASEPLLTVKEEHAGDIKVLYKETDVKDVHIIVFKLKNNGNVPIQENDISIAPAFSFGSRSAILSYEITESYPSDLPAKLQKSDDDSGIALEKLLLNPGDFVTSKILLSNYKNEFKSSCRIAGINEITEYSPFKFPKWLWLGPALIIIVVAGFSLLSLLFDSIGFSSGSSGGVVVTIETLVIIALTSLIIGMTVGVSLTRPEIR